MTSELPSLPELREQLLDTLSVADDQGLWEIVGHLNTESPDAPLDAKVALARALVEDLLDDGVVALTIADWMRTSDEGRPLTSHELERVRHDDELWTDPTECDLLVWVVPAPA